VAAPQIEQSLRYVWDLLHTYSGNWSALQAVADCCMWCWFVQAVYCCSSYAWLHWREMVAKGMTTSFGLMLSLKRPSDVMLACLAP
jgi:hypothetical protein